jgi:hypothetical protein|tara:strand:- start:479 stop:952 length:474 start_codon:yes stop_codon:yes gene_type:complete
MIKTIFSVCMLCAVLTIQAQDAISASGGEATGIGGTVSYSVGQLVNNMNIGSNGTVTQGVQQTIEFTVLSNPELIALTISAVTYPNPTRDYIVLSLTDATLTDLSYIMFDLQGRLITKGKVEQEATQIAMKNLSIGVYILKVNRHNQELKTFKIIKK